MAPVPHALDAFLIFVVPWIVITAIRAYRVWTAPAIPVQLDRSAEAMARSGEVDVLVVGGCAAGLATGACLDAVGVHRYLVVERNARCGDMWRNRYHRLRLHDMKHLCNLPFFPMPVVYPTYVPTKAFADYFDAYASALHIPVLRSSSVDTVTRDQDGRWSAVITSDGEIDSSRVVRAKHVVMAAGVYNAPIVPEIPGKETFKGTTLHSSQYTSCHDLGLVGKRVLVVGYGNSGAEIALELTEGGAAEVYVFIRARLSIVPRALMSTVDALVYIARPLLFIPLLGPTVVLAALMCIDIGGLLYRFVLPSGRRSPVPFSRMPPLLQMVLAFHPPVMDIGTLAAIRSGAIKPLVCLGGELRCFTESGVVLSDNRTVDVDAVIFATGFSVLTAHRDLFPQDVVAAVGTGREAVRKGRISAFTGRVSAKGVRGLWFVYNQLLMIEVMARHVATAVGKDLGQFNGNAITQTNAMFWMGVVNLIAVGVMLAMCARSTLSV
jgi:hypothetical protein